MAQEARRDPSGNEPLASAKPPRSWAADQIERRAVASLIPYARNPRTHSPEQIAQIVSSIRRWGWTNPVIIDEDEMIIAGHGRVMAAQSMGLETVPCVVARGWTEAEKRAYVIADNQYALNAGWDMPLLKAELTELRSLEFEMPLLGFPETDLLSYLPPINGSAPPFPETSQEAADGFTRALTEHEQKQMDVAWRRLGLDWCTILETSIDRGWVSSNYTKGALAVYFLRALFFDHEIPAQCTLAYTPHRLGVPAASSGSLIDGLAALRTRDDMIPRLQFFAAQRPRLDTLITSTIPMLAYRLPGDFPADLARSLYDEFVTEAGGIVLDPCHGWGGRCLGFLLARKAMRYVGFDTDPKTVSGVKAMFDDLEGFASPRGKKLQTQCKPFEDADVAEDSFDFAMTSPPYFNVEKYEGEASSWRRYDGFESWVQGFYAPMITKVYRALRKDAVFALQVGSQTHPLEQVAKNIAAGLGFMHMTTRPTKMINNVVKTEATESEVIILFRKRSPDKVVQSVPSGVDPASKYGNVL